MDGSDARDTAPWVDVVHSALRRLAPEATSVGVAVSGGADSVGLLNVLAGHDDVRITVLHVDHAMRPDSIDDARFVEELAERLELPFHTQRIDVPTIAKARRKNVEAIAREVRYGALTAMAKRASLDVVATAHTLDDQAETVLMQVLRGSVRPAGIRPRRRGIVRPLLDVPRSAVRSWLVEREIEWRDDPTNDDRSRERAWLRHEIVPNLEARRPGTNVRLARFAEAQADVATFLEREVERRFGRELRRSVLAAAPAAVQREALARLLHAAGGSPHQEHLSTALRALDEGTITQFDLPGAVRLRLAEHVVDAVPGSARPAPEVEDGDRSPNVDERWMAHALVLADRAADAGEVPVGAVVVSGDHVVGEGWNARESSGDPTRHAEIEALRRAADATGSWRLAGATLYVTLEPCPMCAGAILQTHVGRVVFGAFNSRDGAFGTVVDLAAGAWKRVPTVEGGVAERACRRRLERFFAARRVRPT